MQIVTATAVVERIGPLTKAVYGFVAAQGKVIAAGVSSPSDWIRWLNSSNRVNSSASGLTSRNSTGPTTRSSSPAGWRRHAV